jgi:hypothetical protein
VSKEVRICGYFSKPKGVPRAKTFAKHWLEGYCAVLIFELSELRGKTRYKTKKCSVPIRGYFSKPKGIPRAKTFGKHWSDGYCAVLIFQLSESVEKDGTKPRNIQTQYCTIYNLT